MTSLKISAIILLACFFSCGKSFSINVTPIKINNHAATHKEILLIDSKINSISSGRYGFIGGGFQESGDRIYIYGKLKQSTLYGADKLMNIPIIAVQFWMSGGNADYQYLLVLDRKKQRIFGPLRIGGRGFRAISIYAINRQIDACVYYYGPNDPMPDPSVKGETGFDLTPHGIVESGAIVNIADADFPKGCIPRP